VPGFFSECPCVARRTGILRFYTPRFRRFATPADVSRPSRLVSRLATARLRSFAVGAGCASGVVRSVRAFEGAIGRPPNRDQAREARPSGPRPTRPGRPDAGTAVRRVGAGRGLRGLTPRVPGLHFAARG